MHTAQLRIDNSISARSLEYTRRPKRASDSGRQSRGFQYIFSLLKHPKTNSCNVERHISSVMDTKREDATCDPRKGGDHGNILHETANSPLLLQQDTACLAFESPSYLFIIEGVRPDCPTLGLYYFQVAYYLYAHSQDDCSKILSSHLLKYLSLPETISISAIL